MAFVPILRIVALSVVLAFAVIVLGMSADLTSTTEKYLEGYFEFAALAIATSAITIFTVPVMIALEIVQPGRAFTSKIVVELSWLTILWVLWLATGADAANAGQLTFLDSSCDYSNSIIQTACRETSAIQALSFLNWIILMAYTIFIFVLTIIAQTRKHSGVWMTSVAEAPFFTPATYNPNEPSQMTSQPTGATIGSYDAATTLHSGGYETQPYPPSVGASQGGTGPASVQAGTVHQMA